MSARVFLDTNILVYAEDRSAGRKRELARELVLKGLRERNGVISTQVLSEFFAIATQKLGVPPDLAQRKVELYAGLEVVTVTVPLIVSAIKMLRLSAISYWDALILTAAAVAGCGTCFTEDLQDGRLYDGVRVVNPFGGKETKARRRQ